MLLRILQTFICIILKHLILTIFACVLFAFLEQQSFQFPVALFWKFILDCGTLIFSVPVSLWLYGLPNQNQGAYWSLSLPGEFSEILTKGNRPISSSLLVKHGILKNCPVTAIILNPPIFWGPSKMLKFYSPTRGGQIITKKNIGKNTIAT